MDAKFKIKVSEIPILAELCRRRKGLDLRPIPIAHTQNVIAKHLSAIINPSSGTIDGEKLKQEVFPTDVKSECKVFISHSHIDIKSAKILASFFDEIGMQPFLDCYVWGSADKLQKELDDKYSMNEIGLYDYEKTQFSSSHVYSLLSSAILEMIDACEWFVFIESENSLDLSVSDNLKSTTLSPWIYSELTYAKYLPSKYPHRQMQTKMFSAMNENLRIRHTVDLNDFIDLKASDLTKLLNTRING